MNNKFLSIFSGVGWVTFGAKAAGYDIIGEELKDSYYEHGKLNLEIAAIKKNQLSLFDA